MSMAQMEFVRTGRSPEGSVGPVEKAMVASASVDFMVSDSGEVDEISGLYPATHGLVSTGIYTVRPDATLTPVDDDVHVHLTGHTLMPTQTESMTALQEWEGRVVAVREEDIVALLVDVTAAETSSESEWGIEDEEAVIPLSEIDEYDLKHLREGSVFRWVIGYGYTRSGRRRRISDIVFRDLPAITVHDRALGEAWAKRMSQSSLD